MSDHSGDEMMFMQAATIRQALLRATELLERSGVEEARSNAELLLLHVLKLERAQLLMAWNDPFPESKLGVWETLLQRKAQGEPIQYMIGEQWFCGRAFEVTPAVLIPRPETELLVEAVLEAAGRLWPVSGGSVAGSALLSNASAESEAPERAAEAVVEAKSMESSVLDKVRAASAAHAAADEPRRAASDAAAAPAILSVADIGTGSGAIAVTLAAQRRDWRVSASDLSPDALEVARRNAVRHGAAGRMAFLQGDLLAPFLPAGGEQPERIGRSGIDVLVSNPPYIPAADLAGLQREVRDYEPHLALDGGADGLDPYRRMLEQLPLLPAMPRIVAFELGIGQPRIVAELMRSIGAWDDIRIITDYGGIERHIIAIRNGA